MEVDLIENVEKPLDLKAMLVKNDENSGRYIEEEFQDSLIRESFTPPLVNAITPESSITVFIRQL